MMNQKEASNYYIATRYPAKGGLLIAKSNLSEKDKCKIEQNCLEIMADDFEHNAIMVYPLGIDKMMVSCTRMVNGSSLESRIHNNTHGVVLTIDEFSKFMVPAMAERNFEEGFCGDNIEEILNYSDEQLAYRFQDDMQGVLNIFFAGLSAEEKKGFFYGVIRVICGECIQLDLPDNQKRIVQAACYSVLPFAMRPCLTTISDGTSPMVEAQILFKSEPLDYKDQKRYKQMSLKSFIDWGNQIQIEKYKSLNDFICKSLKTRTTQFHEWHDLFNSITDKDSLSILLTLDFYDFLLKVQKFEKKEMISGKEDIEIETICSEVERFGRKSKEIRDVLFKTFPFLTSNIEKRKREQMRYAGGLEHTKKFSRAHVMAKTHDNEGVTESKKSNRGGYKKEIEKCISYIKGEESGEELILVRNAFADLEDDEWNTFQMKLRNRLELIYESSERMPVRMQSRYIDVVLFAYEYYHGCAIRTSDYMLLSAPYNIEGVLQFLYRLEDGRMRRYKKLEELVFEKLVHANGYHTAVAKIVRKEKASGSLVCRRIKRLFEDVDKY